jgi:hypothetical protein
MPGFMADVWTTIGKTIYYPITVSNPRDPRFEGVVEHEFIHLRQFEKWGIVLMGLAYVCLPMPFLFSGRWFIEREAYLHDIKTGRLTLEAAVQLLWKAYAYPWPRTLMRKWFVGQTGGRHE